MRFWDDRKEHKCKDGKVVYVLKDLTKLGQIFAVYYPSYNCKVNAGLSTMDEMIMNPKVDVEFKKKVIPVYDDMT